MNILVTGGAGYIGSHILVELAQAGHTAIVIDNLSNSSEQSLHRVEQITGQEARFYKADVCDKEALRAVFSENKVDAVIHLAGLKAVGESVEKPLSYYRNNIVSTLSLCEVMEEFEVKTFIFSSSATVYGSPDKLPLTEKSPVGQNIPNPYGQTKFMIERILVDWASAYTGVSVTLLRYFNPIGAHESGLIGENPKDTPNNLFPYIAQVAIGKREKLSIFGNDYHTADGTAIRDYVHVVDLARGHIAALDQTAPGIEVFNLGTGKGVSVLEAVRAFEKASGKSVPYEIVDRRTGDVAVCYADVEKAARILQWRAQYSLLDACRDIWRWQIANPDGYINR